VKIEVQDQKQHMIISICSLIIGNQISERTGSKPEPVAAKEPAAPQQASECVEVPAKAEPEVAATQPQPQPQPQQKSGLHPVIGKAIGTLVLAFLIWLIFGRRARKHEQAE